MSLANAIFTDRQARLFRWLFGQPERSFFLNELLRLSGLSSASLQQELKRLTLSGVVLSTRMGNLRVFQANPKSPLFHELVSLTRKTCGVQAALMQALEPLRPKLARAFIYGSVAKQEDTSASDVDLMLVGVDLTLAEAQVAALVVAGQSADQIATQRQVSVGTVRTQIKALLEKTGSERQIELVARLRALT